MKSGMVKRKDRKGRVNLILGNGSGNGRLGSVRRGRYVKTGEDNERRRL